MFPRIFLPTTGRFAVRFSLSSWLTQSHPDGWRVSEIVMEKFQYFYRFSSLFESSRLANNLEGPADVPLAPAYNLRRLGKRNTISDPNARHASPSDSNTTTPLLPAAKRRRLDTDSPPCTAPNANDRKADIKALKRSQSEDWDIQEIPPPVPSLPKRGASQLSANTTVLGGSGDGGAGSLYTPTANDKELELKTLELKAKLLRVEIECHTVFGRPFS